MNDIRNSIGTAIGVAMTIGFATLILALVLSLAAGQFPALRAVGAELRCLIGLPEDGSACMTRKLAALDAQRRALDEERQRLGDVIAAQSFVFSQGAQLSDGITLVAGTLYEDVTAQSGLIRSFCWAVIDNGGLDPRVGLAVMHGDGRIEELTPDAGQRGLLKMSAGAIDAARASCPFPQVS